MIAELLRKIKNRSKPKDRVVIEGTYGGDWLDSYMRSQDVPVIPSNAKVVVVNEQPFDLVGGLRESGSWTRYAQRSAQTNTSQTPQINSQFDVVRYLIASDGRIFQRRDLTRECDVKDLHKLVVMLNKDFQGKFDKLYTAYMVR